MVAHNPGKGVIGENCVTAKAIIPTPTKPSVSRSHRVPILGTSPSARIAPNMSSHARDCGR